MPIEMYGNPTLSLRLRLQKMKICIILETNRQYFEGALKMTLRRLVLIGCVVMAAFILSAQFASAGVLDGLAFSVGCNGFSSEGGALVLDRNNTGTNREAFILSATDGNGNVILAPVTDSALVGTRLEFDQGAFFPWTTAPVSNPITLTITSPAGNSLAEQQVYQAKGDCDTFTPSSVTVTPPPSNGTTSPSVPLNGVPPRPANPDTTSDFQPGYLLVNTSHLSMRSGDGIEFTLVGIVDGGTRLVAVGRNRRASWWLVQAGELRGWVVNDLVVVRGDLSGVPIVDSLGEITPASLVLFHENLIYAQPGTRAICVVSGASRGISYRVVGRTPKATFFQIEANCNGDTVQGWIAANLGVFRNPAGVSIPVTS
jgi:hypothetical protein